jgi:hypothetical protein
MKWEIALVIFIIAALALGFCFREDQARVAERIPVSQLHQGHL